MSADVRNRKKKIPPDGGTKEGKDVTGTTSGEGLISENVPSATGNDPSAGTSPASVLQASPQQQTAPATAQRTLTVPQKRQVVYKEEHFIVFEIPQKWFYILLSLIAFLCVILCALFVVGYNNPHDIPPELANNLGEDGVRLFQQHDRDEDGYLSIHEFEPLVYRLLETNVSGPVYDVPIEADDEMITLRTYFIPIVKESMSKDLNDSLPGTLNTLHGLETWNNASLSWMNFGASHFAELMPKDVDNIVLGKSYSIIETTKGMFPETISSNRYYPPKVSTNGSILIHRLLTLFHPRPFVMSRFPAQGSVACVRAHNDKYLDIVFRIHAEFQLNEPPYHPFWYSPAQFTGNIIISKDGHHIVYFNLYLPNDKRLNIDMEWLNGPNESENMEVDIGYMPLMQINSTQSSVPVTNLEEYQLLEPLPEKVDHKLTADNIEWMTTIELDDAKRSLQKYLYPFAEVPYYNMTVAFKKAEEEKKLVHSILLWGALDDQSC